jgi:hypothetical protein
MKSKNNGQRDREQEPVGGRPLDNDDNKPVIFRPELRRRKNSSFFARFPPGASPSKQRHAPADHEPDGTGRRKFSVCVSYLTRLIRQALSNQHEHIVGKLMGALIADGFPEARWASADLCRSAEMLPFDLHH